ncbi:MAG: fibronectin type III domain-containing protein [Gemmatimonadales bacterium]|nr:fibronectin type III domain-containing protein [Gemmatimonadales bacterium]
MPRTVRTLLALALVALSAPMAPAQGPPAAPRSAAAGEVGRLAVVVADGRVFLYPSRAPSDGEGWLILRDGTPLTREPMTGALGPAEFSAIVGPDLPLVEGIAGTSGSVATWRRLRAGGSAAGIAQVLSPRAALAMGALYVDSTTTAGALHTYEAHLVRLSRPDSVVRRARAVVRVTTTVLPTPAAPQGRVRDGVIAISWRSPAFTGASDDPIVAYVVERADSVGGFTRITQTPVMRLADGTGGHSDASAAAGRLYRYRIRAADLIGRLSAPSVEVAVRAPGQRGPLPPVAVGAEVVDGRIRVVWTLPPEPQARSYHVERSVGGDSNYVRVTRTPLPYDVPEYIDTQVRGREIYSYRVRVLDDAGRIGPASNPTTTRGIDLTAPGAPTQLVARQVPGHAVRLSWRAPADRDIRGYEVHRAESGDTVFARLTGEPRAGLTYADAGYDGATLEPGREYAWRVFAVDSSGNSSPFAEVRLRLPDDEAPEAARSILLRNHLGRWMEISWAPSPSADVVRYVVERAGAAPIPVGTVDARGTLTVRDTTAEKGRVGRWSVVAIDSAGNRSPALTDTLTFRDLTRPPAPRRVTAVRAEGATSVKWERVVSSDLRGYVVYRAERTDGPRTRITAAPITALEFVDRAGTATSRYVVRAVDANGNESDESPVAVTVERRP